MLFNSFSFLAFFGVLAGVYYALPHRFRWPLLLAASLYFYAAFEPFYVLVLLAITLVAYGGALALGGARRPRTRRAILAASVVLVLGALLFLKYYDFLAGSIDALLLREDIQAVSLFPRFPRLELVLLVGLSFYTFSCVSYLVDVYRGSLAPERHLGHFALYVSFFPKLLAGPIERAKPFLAQLREPVTFSAEGVALGLHLMLWGLFKKVLIADNLAGFVDAAYAQPAFAAPADLVIATYFFAFQLYCDFSGYSDMAIGAALVLGIRLMENFRRPYLSTSVPEFWSQRWHLSLASWFRDYLYIPLGGGRVGRLRKYGNVMTVFLVSGLWHGANWTFVVWGGVNGLYCVVSDATHAVRERVAGLVRVPPRIGTVLATATTFHLVLVSWVFFRAASLPDAATILGRITAALPDLPSLLYSRVLAGGVLFPVGLIAALLVIEILDEIQPVWERLALRPVYVRWGVYYATIFALLLLGAWQSREFVYMQF